MSFGGGDDENKIEEAPEQKELASIAAERWGDYEQRFIPLENEFMQRIDQGEGDFMQAESMASGRNAASFSDANQQATQGLMAQGAAPGSGRFMDSMGDMAGQQGMSLGQGMAKADLGVEDLHYRGLENIVAMGQGTAASGIGGLTDVAYQSGSDAMHDAQLSLRDSQATASAIGNAVGMGFQYMGGAQGMNQMGNQGYIQSGLKYDTNPGSETTQTLAKQERSFGLL